MIRMTCEGCGAKYQVPDAVGGKTTRCTKCRQLILIPAVASQAAAPAAPEAAPPPAMGGVSPARPAEIPAPPPQAPPPPVMAQSSAYPTQPVAPRKSHALLITLIVIGAVLVTLVGGGLFIVLYVLPANQAKALAKEKQDKDDGIISVVQAEVDMSNEQAKSAMSGLAQIETLDPLALDQARKNLADAKTRNDEVTGKLGHMNLQSQKAKDLLVGLQDNRKKIAENIERIDEALWPGPGTPKEMFERVRPSVPQIIIPPPTGTPSEFKFLSSGSGVLLESGGKWCVATNRHVVTGGKDGLTVIFRPLGSTDDLEIKVPATAITKIHKFTDLAVIELADQDVALLKKNKIRPLLLNPEDPKDKPVQGDLCWVVGHPGGGVSEGEGTIQVSTFGDGSIANMMDMQGYLNCLEITAPINPGNSGGPLFNKFGRVIGQVTFYRMDKDRQNYAVDVSLLRGLLNPGPGSNWTVDAREIHRILSPAVALKEDYAEAVAAMDKQGFVPAPLNPRQTGILTIDNTTVNQVPLVLSEAKPYKVVVITCWTAVLNLYVAKGGRLASAPILKNNCVWLPLDVPAGPANIALAIVNDHLGVHTPCVVALFKKK
jgi:S1-C subfamily serine protease